MKWICCIVLLCLLSCDITVRRAERKTPAVEEPAAVFLIVLGTLQDGGSPHIGCKKKCCENLFSEPDSKRKVVSLGIIDPANKLNYLIEATPDITTQLRILKDNSPCKRSDVPDGIFLTHAHIGHYAGLMYFGKEAMNADSAKVYVMPRMKMFLETNGPWSQLVKLGNIELEALDEANEIVLGSSLRISPFVVPHRDEYSETVGYRIGGRKKKVLFIPDIDTWSKWQTSIVEKIKKVDYAFIDATFFDAQEINNRAISQIPHPFVIESMELFSGLPLEEKNKIYFIHFNHTSPLLDPRTEASKAVIEKGFHIAKIGQLIEL